MTDKTAKQTADYPLILLKLFTRDLPAIIVPLVLFGGGIVLLALKIPGWSIFLGLPATQIGLVFLILNFDKVSRKNIGLGSLHEINCGVCGELTLAPFWYDEIVCPKCRGQIKQKLDREEN